MRALDLSRLQNESIEGVFSRFELPHLLMVPARKRMTGALKLVEGTAVRMVGYAAGGPTVAASSLAEERLGALLLTRGVLEAGQLTAIDEAMRSQGLQFGAAATTLGILTKADLARWLKEQHAYVVTRCVLGDGQRASFGPLGKLPPARSGLPLLRCIEDGIRQYPPEDIEALQKQIEGVRFTITPAELELATDLGCTPSVEQVLSGLIGNNKTFHELIASSEDDDPAIPVLTLILTGLATAEGQAPMASASERDAAMHEKPSSAAPARLADVDDVLAGLAGTPAASEPPPAPPSMPAAAARAPAGASGAPLADLVSAPLLESTPPLSPPQPASVGARPSSAFGPGVASLVGAPGLGGVPDSPPSAPPRPSPSSGAAFAATAARTPIQPMGAVPLSAAFAPAPPAGVPDAVYPVAPAGVAAPGRGRAGSVVGRLVNTVFLLTLGAALGIGGVWYLQPSILQRMPMATGPTAAVAPTPPATTPAQPPAVVAGDQAQAPEAERTDAATEATKPEAPAEHAGEAPEPADTAARDKTEKVDKVEEDKVASREGRRTPAKSGRGARETSEGAKMSSSGDSPRPVDTSKQTAQAEGAKPAGGGEAPKPAAGAGVAPKIQELRRLLAANDHRQVIVVATEILQQEPRNGFAYRSLGIAYSALGAKPQACESFRRYLRFAGNPPDKAQIEAILGACGP